MQQVKLSTDFFNQEDFDNHKIIQDSLILFNKSASFKLFSGFLRYFFNCNQIRNLSDVKHIVKIAFMLMLHNYIVRF